MKKIININFQGRVIPIEESAYDALKQYVESLRRYFANEEGRDEIINDIESRIAELFSERLKHGAACITDEDVASVVASIGRPQDFEEQGGGAEEKSGPQQAQQPAGGPATGGYGPTGGGYGPAGRGRLYRNADDKIIGGVCSGLANYLGIDPVILRIIFVVLFGAIFWVYILLWIIVPSQSLQTNITKRLYRNPDDKVIAGVCGGLASYFNIDTWVPRLIFALPLIIGLISGTMNAIWWNWDFGFAPRIITGSLGSTLFITYIILWIAVPFATTASEKLEMRGERVDLNSIRDTVKEDLENFKTKAEKWGHEVKQTAQEFGQKAQAFGQTAGSQVKPFAQETSQMMRRTSSGFGHVIGILFKAFFLFVAGVVAITLFVALISLLFGGAAFPVKNFFLEGRMQHLLVWSTLILFLGVPLIALITWLIRRVMGVRSRNHYLGYVFGGLWIIGIISFVVLFGVLAQNFKYRAPVEDKVVLAQPTGGKLVMGAVKHNTRFYNGEWWFGLHFDDDFPIYGNDMDTLMLNNIRILIRKSIDSEFHLTRVRLSRGSSREMAEQTAGKIYFNPEQKDSLLFFPEGFAISEKDKFRNQQVALILEVPVGKRVEMNQSLDRYNWWNMNFNNNYRHDYFQDSYDNRDYNYEWWPGNEYIMSPDGLKNLKDLDPKELKLGHYKEIKKDDQENNNEENNDQNQENKDSKFQYRYKQIEDSLKVKAKEQLRDEMKVKDSLDREKKIREAIKSNASVQKEERKDAYSEDNGYNHSPILAPVLMLEKVF